MRKILIVDDRVERQKSQLGENDFEELKTIPGVKLMYELPAEEALGEYSLLAFHLSYLKQEKRLGEIQSYVQREGKQLILFSGGIAQHQFSEKGRRLTLNSRDFYSSQLIPFLKDFLKEDANDRLIKLLYGENWKLPLLVRFRHLLWQYGDLNGDLNGDLQEEIGALMALLGEAVKDEKSLNEEIEKYFNQF